MASEFDTVQTTVTKPAPLLEGSLTAFLKSIDKLGKGAIPAAGFTGIDTSKYDPKVAAQDALQKQAAQAAAGLGALTGPDAYKTIHVALSATKLWTQLLLSLIDKQQLIHKV